MNHANSAADAVHSRYRRLVMLAAGALLVVFVGGLVWAIPSIENDLTSKVSARLAGQGITGVAVRFSGQDAVLRCVVVLDDPDMVKRQAQAVNGVRTVTLDPVCTGRVASEAPIGGGSVAPTDTTAAPPPNDLRATITLIDGAFTLAGTVASAEQVQALVAAAGQAVDPQFITSNIVVQPGISIDPAVLERVATLVSSMPANLMSGELTFDGTTLRLTGTYPDEASRDNLTRLGADAGATLALQPRPTATPADALVLQRDLNAYVTANPIQFDSNQATLAPEASVVLDHIAEMAKQFAGTTIEVQGHTDNTGDPVRNLWLSTTRADAVVAALIARGVPAGQLVGSGYGVTRPKVPNTSRANRAINRRVEFVVTVSRS
ncbi:unannotated protein [freshwater metagenome]|uniref:Unannotated protein n=1 Tax=freshwater metagenome TaxID=449393 RepID=A0A6J7ERJ9_9ZZZZ|nr:OmpA family protein [Actinomycetota bacterium]